MAIDPRAPSPAQHRHRSTSVGARPPGRTDRPAFRIVAFAAGFLVLVILVLIAYSTISKAWPAFRDEGLSYFTSDTWDPAHAAFGTLAFSFGTLVISVIALVVSVPISIGIALFVTELSPRWMRRPIVTLVDLLAAVPSVVYGLWGLLVLVPALPASTRAGTTSLPTFPCSAASSTATRSRARRS